MKSGIRKLAEEVWYDFLIFVGRRQLAGQSEFLGENVSWIIQNFLHEYGYIKIGNMIIVKEQYTAQLKGGNWHQELLPFPSVELPEPFEGRPRGIQSFKSIKICYIDSEVLNLLNNMTRLLDHCSLAIKSSSPAAITKFLTNCGNIKSVKFYDEQAVEHMFDRHIATILNVSSMEVNFFEGCHTHLFTWLHYGIEHNKACIVNLQQGDFKDLVKFLMYLVNYFYHANEIPIQPPRDKLLPNFSMAIKCNAVLGSNYYYVGHGGHSMKFENAVNSGDQSAGTINVSCYEMAKEREFIDWHSKNGECLNYDNCDKVITLECDEISPEHSFDLMLKEPPQ